MTPDNVCGESAERGTLVETKLLSQEGGHPLAVLRGDRATMLFLADLFRAVADRKPGYDISLAPDGAGARLFTRSSDIGIYIELTK